MDWKNFVHEIANSTEDNLDEMLEDITTQAQREIRDKGDEEQDTNYSTDMEDIIYE